MDTKAVGVATRAVAKAERKLKKITDSKDVGIAIAVSKSETRFATRIGAATKAVTDAKAILLAVVTA